MNLLQVDDYDYIIPHFNKWDDGRWYYARANADYWFKSASKRHSLDHFLLGTLLFSMEVWDIIGIEI